MYKGILHTHYLVVTLFLLLYVIKTILLLSNKNEMLAGFVKKTRVAEMIISSLFLLTGIYLATQLPYGGKFDYLFWIKLAMVFVSIPVAIIGFKRSNKVLAALSLLLITGSYGIAETYKKKKNIPKESSIELSATDGATLYSNYCMRCHGSDGKSGLAGAKNLNSTLLDVNMIKQVILKGQGDMPAAPVTDTQAGSIADYVAANLKGH